MVIPIILLAVGFVLLIKGGDYFVDGATGIARHFHLPEILIGATVVSIGTTLPEVMVSSGAALRGSGSIAYGNAIGSIICNTALIAAITIAAKPGAAARKSLVLPVAFFFGATAVYCFSAYVLGEFTRFIGIVLLLMFLAYMTVTVLQMKNTSALSVNETAENTQNEGENRLFKDIILLVAGAVVIACGADLLVDNAIIIAEKLGVSEKVIGLTIVALGTSLPEFVTAITSLIKGHGSLSLGNVIGANLFNLVLVSGAAVTINPFKVPVSGYIGGINSSLALDIPLMIAVMLILTVPALVKEKLYRFQGILLLALYAAFCGLQVCL